MQIFSLLIFYFNLYKFLFPFVVETTILFVMTMFYHCLSLDAGLLARSQYPEGPMTGLLDTGFFFFGFPGSKSKC
jgi:hypothetical protein